MARDTGSVPDRLSWESSLVVETDIESEANVVAETGSVAKTGSAVDTGSAKETVLQYPSPKVGPWHLIINHR